MSNKPNTPAAEEPRECNACKYPGVAINEADKDKATDALEKERTETLNDNPFFTDNTIDE